DGIRDFHVTGVQTCALPISNWLKRKISTPYGIYLFILPLYLVTAFLKPFFPVTHALIDDWFSFSRYLIFFFYGFVLISAKEPFRSEERRVGKECRSRSSAHY